MAAKGGNLIGSWAFLIGVVLAVILGFVGQADQAAWTITFVIIGLIIGLLNVTDKEVGPFLMSGAVIIIASAFGGSVLMAVKPLQGIFNALLTIFVPATVIVAIKNVFTLARR